MYGFSRVWSIFSAESARCLVFFYHFFLLCVAKSILQYAHIYSVIIPFIVKNTIRDKYRKNCFSDGVKLRHNLLKECVSKRLGPFLLYVSGRINFCITLSVIFAPTRKSIMKVVQLAKITFYRWFFRQWCVSFENCYWLQLIYVCTKISKLTVWRGWRHPRTYGETQIRVIIGTYHLMTLLTKKDVERITFSADIKKCRTQPFKVFYRRTIAP